MRQRMRQSSTDNISNTPHPNVTKGHQIKYTYIYIYINIYIYPITRHLINFHPAGSRSHSSPTGSGLPLAVEVDGGDRQAEVVELGEVAGAEGLWRRWLRPQGLAPRRTVLARTKRHSCRCPDISYQPTTEKRRRSKRF